MPKFNTVWLTDRYIAIVNSTCVALVTVAAAYLVFRESSL